MLPFVIGLAVSIGLHEIGHLVPAKLFGVKVTQYMIGFGPTIWSRRRGETEYGVKAIPAGGFVKIVGMTPQDDDVAPEDEPRAMWRQPVWKRTIVMAAGSVTHFALAFLIVFGVILVMGKQNPEASPDTAAAYVTISPCVIVANEDRDCTTADPKSPAVQAGLRDGDRIVALNGVSTPTYTDLVKAIRSTTPGPVQLSYERDGATRTMDITLAAVQRAPLDSPDGDATTTSALGVTNKLPPGVSETVSVGPGEAVSLSGRAMKDSVANVFVAMKKFPEKVPKLFAALSGEERDQQTPISVVGASRLGGETVERGLWSVFFGILFGLNLFVGIFNLLPLLPLDGGHIAIAWFEKVRSWIYARIGRRDPGRVDYMKLMPITYAVILIFGGFTLHTVAADIVNPITLPR